MIEKRKLGKTGLMVPALGWGAGRIGGGDTTDAGVDRLIGRALELGVTLVDTARSYGASEERLGRALAGRRDRFVLSTKVGYGVPGIPDWTGPCITAGVDAALARLRTDWLDVVHLHSCPRGTLEQSGVADALAAAVAAGKVRAAAYSGEGDALDWAVASGAFAVIQTSVSVVDQGGLDGAVAAAAARGMGVLGKRPLGNAPWRFAGRPAEEDVAQAWERWRALGLSLDEPGDAFARFSAHAPGVSAILLGTANVAHLEAAALSVARGPLPGSIVQSLRDAWHRVGRDWSGIV